MSMAGQPHSVRPRASGDPGVARADGKTGSPPPRGERERSARDRQGRGRALPCPWTPSACCGGEVGTALIQGPRHQRMIPKSGYRFSEKIMRHQ